MACLAFLEVIFFWISWLLCPEMNPSHLLFPWMTVTTELSENDRPSSPWYTLYLKSRQQKQCWREKQMASELSLQVWWLMWAELVYLLAYLQKRSVPYVGSSSEWGPEAAAAMQNTPLPPHNIKGLSIYPQITACSPMMTKVTVDPSWGQGDKWQGFLPLELKNGLTGAHSTPAGSRRGGQDCRAGEWEKAVIADCSHLPTRSCYLCLPTTISTPRQGATSPYRLC